VTILEVVVRVTLPAVTSPYSQELAYEAIEREVDVYATVHDALCEKFKRTKLLAGARIEVEDV